MTGSGIQVPSPSHRESIESIHHFLMDNLSYGFRIWLATRASAVGAGSFADVGCVWRAAFQRVEQK